MNRDKAAEAARLLNDLWWDILAGDGTFQILEDYQIPIRSEEHLIGIQRMIFFHLAMVLCKLSEFHRHYSRHLSPECRSWLKDLNAEVERRGIRDVRNTVIGHILDKDSRTPMTREMVDQFFTRAVDHDGEQFYCWMRNPGKPGDLDTVMGRVKWLIDEIMREHELTASDLGLATTPRRLRGWPS